MNLFTLNTAASGLFAPVQQDASSYCFDQANLAQVYNPGVFEYRRGSYELVTDEKKVLQWLERSTGESKWQIDASHLDSYADVAVKLASNLIQKHADCRLAPLRGAARPSMLVEVMSRGVVEFEFFNFKQGSSGKRDDEIRRDLIQILQRKNPGNELYRLQVIDTAVGGQGINKLVSLLKSIHAEVGEFRRQSWCVDVHLLHPTNGHENIGNMDSIAGMSDDQFIVMPNRYPVPDLIVEDYDEALGFTIERENCRYVAKPSFVPGRFLLRSGDTMCLVESDDLYRTFDELISEAVTESLLTDANRELVEVVWQEFTTKG